MLPAMFRPESGHPAMRVQRYRLGSIDSSRGFGPRSRSRSPSPRSHRRHHRSPPNRRSSHRSYRSPSPRRFSRRYSPSYSARQHSRYPGRRSESSVEKYLRDIVENDIGTSSSADSLSNVNRDDLADGPIFSRVLSHPWNLERDFFRGENPSRPFSMRHDEDSYNRDIFIAQLDRSINSEFLHQSRENKRGEVQESKYFQYDREDRLFDESIKSRAMLAKTEKYYKQSLNKSPSLMYMDEDFRKLERIRRKREEDLRSRNISTDYLMPDSANKEESSESRHHYRSEKTPAVPLKSILKKRSDDSSIQDSNFSKGTKPHKTASQDGSGFSCILGTTTDSTCAPDKRLDPFPDNIEDEEKFLYGEDDGDSNNCLYSQKITMSEKKEPVSEKVKSPPTAKLKYLKQSVKPENSEQSVKPKNSEQSIKPENSEQSVKPDNLEQSSVEYGKICDVLKTIGLDIGMTEIDKLAARTEERLHGKKTAYSPNHHSVANHKVTSLETQKHSLSPFDSFPSPKAVSPVLKSDYNNIAISGQNKAADMCEQSGVPGYLIPSAPPSFLDNPPGPISGSCHDVPYASTFTPTQFFPNSASLPVALPGYDVNQHHMSYATSNWCAQQVDSVYKPEVANDAKLNNKCRNRNLTVINTVTISNSKQFQHASTTAPYSNKRFHTPIKCRNHNLKTINTITISNSKQFQDASTTAPYSNKQLHTPIKCGNHNLKTFNTITISNSEQFQDTSTTAPYSDQKSESKAAKKRAKRRRAAARKAEQKKAAEIGQTSPENKATEERQILERIERHQKGLFYQRIELERLSKQQAEMLQKKRKEEDPLLVQLTKMKESIANNVARLESNIKALKEKQGELDKVIHSSELNCLEKSQKLSSENKDSSENDLPKNSQSEERIFNSI